VRALGHDDEPVEEDEPVCHAAGMMFTAVCLAMLWFMIELAARDSGTLHVALLWQRETGVFAVTAEDSSTGDRFELVVDNDRPLDIYYHPYAYAALRGVEYAVAA
jgi:hypothetical protein